MYVQAIPPAPAAADFGIGAEQSGPYRSNRRESQLQTGAHPRAEIRIVAVWGNIHPPGRIERR